MPTLQQATKTQDKLVHQAWTITAEQIRELCPRATLNLEILAADMTEKFPKYGIDTHLRVCHFMAHAAVESAYFTTLVEFSSGRQYEGNKNLGNTHKGDGPRYKGRGLLQLTGRWNYGFIGKKVLAPLEAKPEMAEMISLAIPIACEFWKYRHCNASCDLDNIRRSTFRVNGGYNGIAERTTYLAKAKRIWVSPGGNVGGAGAG